MRSDDTEFRAQVALKASRKLKARRTQAQGLWFSVGFFGVVGWSIVVPTLGGAFLGAWLDRHHPNGHSWTLACMIAGLLLGCANTWHWISSQHADMGDEPETPDV